MMITADHESAALQQIAGGGIRQVRAGLRSLRSPWYVRYTSLSLGKSWHTLPHASPGPRSR